MKKITITLLIVLTSTLVLLAFPVSAQTRLQNFRQSTCERFQSNLETRKNSFNNVEKKITTSITKISEVIENSFAKLKDLNVASNKLEDYVIKIEQSSKEVNNIINGIKNLITNDLNKNCSQEALQLGFLRTEIQEYRSKIQELREKIREFNSLVREYRTEIQNIRSKI